MGINNQQETKIKASPQVSLFSCPRPAVKHRETETQGNAKKVTSHPEDALLLANCCKRHYNREEGIHNFLFARKGHERSCKFRER